MLLSTICGGGESNVICGAGESKAAEKRLTAAAEKRLTAAATISAALAIDVSERYSPFYQETMENMVLNATQCIHLLSPKNPFEPTSTAHIVRLETAGAWKLHDERGWIHIKHLGCQTMARC